MCAGTEWLVPKSPVAFHSLGLLPVCIGVVVCIDLLLGIVTGGRHCPSVHVSGEFSINGQVVSAGLAPVSGKFTNIGVVVPDLTWPRVLVSFGMSHQCGPSPMGLLPA